MHVRENAGFSAYRRIRPRAVPSHRKFRWYERAADRPVPDGVARSSWSLAAGLGRSTPAIMASRKCFGGLMQPSLHEILHSYNDQSPLEDAHTIPASWYVDEQIARLERQFVFGGTWQVVAGVEQLKLPGQFVTRELAGEPLI